MRTNGKDRDSKRKVRPFPGILWCGPETQRAEPGRPIFMWFTDLSEGISHSGFLKISLLIFLTCFFSPHTPPVSFCQGSSTSVVLPSSLCFSVGPTASPDQSTSTVTIIITTATTTAMTSLTEYLEASVPALEKFSVKTSLKK